MSGVGAMRASVNCVPGGQRGAAIVMAMLVVAVTAALVAGVFWRQNVALRQVENDLAYAQARTLIAGAIDWAGVILREDARSTGVDHLGEPWAVPLAETALNSEDSVETAYVSGQIRDAQGMFNLRNLVGQDGTIDAGEVQAFRRLLGILGVDESVADAVAQRVLASLPGRDGRAATAIGLMSCDDLRGIAGLVREDVERMRGFVTSLPEPTAVNANTAPAEVLAARIRNLTLGDARQLVASRGRAFFKDRADVLNRVPRAGLDATDREISVVTRYFLVDGAVGYRRARLRSEVLVRREGASRVHVLWSRDSA